MPGREIKGRSKIANYRHGGRAGYKEGKKVVGKQPKLAGTDEAGRLIKRPTKDDVIKGKA